MNSDFMRQVGAAQMSETVNLVAKFAQSMPLETEDDLKTGFATCFHALCLAMDQGNIDFSEDEDKAMFYGLLSVTLTYVLGQKPDLVKVRTQ